jgi:ABC-type amino acid transport substrate-binding protein
MNTSSLRFLLPALLLLFSSRAHSADLVMGVEELPYMPYYSVDGGEYKGFARELFDAFAQEQGHHIRYRPLPVERLYRELLDGGIDLKFPDNPEWRHDLKSDKNLHYSQPVAAFLDGVMMRAEPASAVNNKRLTIGTIRGFTPWPLLPLIEQKRIRLAENNSISGLLRQVIAKRLDGVYINVAVARFHLKNVLRQDLALAFDARLPYDQSAYFVSSIHKAEIIQELNAWLEQNSQRVADMQRKWGIEQ